MRVQLATADGPLRAAIRIVLLAMAGSLLPNSEAVADLPRLAIIIDDLGNQAILGRRAIELPGAVTCAFLPGAPHAERLAAMAHRRGKEVMLHLPMEPLDGAREAGMLRQDMSRDAVRERIRAGLLAIPHVRGVNNHMGSLLTQSVPQMEWVMEALRAHADELYFIDSYTSAQSVAWEVASANQLASARRDVFLDADRDPRSIELEFERLVALARSRGQAIGIAHPYPETLEFLERRLPMLEGEGVALVTVSSLLRKRDETGGDERKKPVSAPGWRMTDPLGWSAAVP